MKGTASCLASVLVRGLLVMRCKMLISKTDKFQEASSHSLHREHAENQCQSLSSRVHDRHIDQSLDPKSNKWDAHEVQSHLRHLNQLLTYDEDDSYDVSDDEMDIALGRGNRDPRMSELGGLLLIQTEHDQGRSLMSPEHSLSYMLATYQPNSLSSPLQDETAAHIYSYFINVTGPSLSMYEKHTALSPQHGRSYGLISHQQIWTRKCYSLCWVLLRDELIGCS